jgi:hypothetical protein
VGFRVDIPPVLTFLGYAGSYRPVQFEHRYVSLEAHVLEHRTPHEQGDITNAPDPIDVDVFNGGTVD